VQSNFRKPNESAFSKRSDFRTPIPLAGKYLMFENPLYNLSAISRSSDIEADKRQEAALQLQQMLINTPGKNNLLLFNQQ
tara:strand:- start:724 stop:963 length:240 start_codon:yes stop_codon:yes gene_type:complete